MEAPRYLPRQRWSGFASLVALAISSLTLQAQNVERLVGCHAFNASLFFWSSHEAWSQTELEGATGLIELRSERHPRQDLVDARHVRVPGLLDTLERERVVATSYWRPIAPDSVEISWGGGRRQSVLRMRIEDDTLLSRVKQGYAGVLPGERRVVSYRSFGERVDCPSLDKGRVRLPASGGAVPSRAAGGVAGCYSFPSRPFSWTIYEQWSRTVLRGNGGLIELREEAHPMRTNVAGARRVRVPGLLDPEEAQHWYRWSHWRLIGQDSVRISWYSGLYGPFFRLRIRGDSLLGLESFSSDIVGGHKPQPKPVAAVRVPCPSAR